jgi:DNA-binding SARP family transcriptional activator
MGLVDSVARIALGQTLALTGRHAEARDQLARALRSGRRYSSESVQFFALLLLAFSHLGANEDAPAVAELRNALAIGSRAGFESRGPLRPEVWSQLLARAIEAGIETDYATKLAGRATRIAESPEDHNHLRPIGIFTFGRFSVVLASTPLAFRRKAQRKPLELLKALIAKGGRGVAHAELGAELWPELDGDAGHNAVNLTIHRLRRLLRKDEAITVRAGKVGLDPTFVWVDAWAFERLCTSVDKLGAERGSAAADELHEIARRVLRLYTGPFLSGEDFSWAIPPRERMRSKLVRAISALATKLGDTEGEAVSIALYSRAIELEPLAEELHRSLMQQYQAQGRIAEALDAYRRCHDTLLSQLGVSPSTATRAIYRSLRSR